MKHLLLIVVSVLVAAVGVLILVESKCATLAAILSGSGFILLSLALAIPAKLAEAKGTLADLARAIKDAITVPTTPPSGGAT